MAKESKPKSGGAAATTAGTTFQEDVACYFSVLILSEANAEPPLALPATTRLLDLVAESAQPVDDLVLQTSEGGVLFVQAKNSLSLSDREDSELASVFGQFVRQFVSGVNFPGRERRPLDARDRLALAVSQRAPATISHDLLATTFDRASDRSLAGLIKNPFNLKRASRRSTAGCSPRRRKHAQA